VLVYGDRRVVVQPLEILERLRARAVRVGRAEPGLRRHSGVVELLLESGELTEAMLDEAFGVMLLVAAILPRDAAARRSPGAAGSLPGQPAQSDGASRKVCAMSVAGGAPRRAPWSSISRHSA